MRSLVYSILRKMGSKIVSRCIKSLPMSILTSSISRRIFKGVFYKRYIGGRSIVEVINKQNMARSTIQRHIILNKVGEDYSALNYNELLNDLSLLKGSPAYDGFALKFSSIYDFNLNGSNVAEALNCYVQKTIALFQTISDLGMNVYIDGETSDIQDYIDYIYIRSAYLTSINAPRVHHTNIYNTYQCYRHSVASKLSAHSSLLSSIQAPFACKLVKGAYLEFEKKRKTLLGSKEEVALNYRNVVEWLSINSNLREDRTFVMLATHNARCLQMFNKIVLSKSSNRANFTTAHLHGFLSNKAWFDGKTCKYIPYGNPDEAWEYVKRRIHENRESASSFS